VLKEVAEFVFLKAKEQAEKQGVKVLPLPGNGVTTYYELGGKVCEHKAPADLREFAVNTVEGLIEATKRWKLEKPSIWIGAAGGVIKIPFDEADRREYIEMSLRTTPLFETLKGLDERKGGIDQVTLIRLLRREFRKGLGAEAMLAAVRKLKFRSSTQGTTDVQHGNESMGRIIENEVTGASDIPTSLVVPCSVFANPGEQEFEFQVGLDVEIDAVNQKFIVRPFPGEIDKAVELAIESIRTRLKNNVPGASIFFGSMG
jgi:hypothetical protein